MSDSCALRTPVSSEFSGPAFLVDVSSLKSSTLEKAARKGLVVFFCFSLDSFDSLDSLDSVMGASTSSLVGVAANEQILRFVSPEALKKENPVWNQLLSFEAKTPRCK